jgi:predicted component of viral defense system (DUF524 family)
MITIKDSLVIPLDHLNPYMVMEIYSNSSDKNILLTESDSKVYNEAEYQVFEGKNYWYKLIESEEWDIDVEITSGVFGNINDKKEGRFNPNTFVGTFQIPFKNAITSQRKFIPIEIRSSKISYEKGITDEAINKERSEYQVMLDQIAEHSIDLVMQYNVPIQQSFESSLELINEKQLYQRFIFVKSLFKNNEFEEAVQKIVSNPATRWVNREEVKDIRSIRKLSNRNIKEIISRPNRIKVNGVIPNLDSVPLKIHSTKKEESVDTPENRFIKHILNSFLSFSENILSRLNNDKNPSDKKEVENIVYRLEALLNQNFFKEIGMANTLKLNSPVLQRRSGYRELLRAWLRFHLTAQLSWNLGENDIFSGGKKDIATLYEYWVFFVLFKSINDRYGNTSIHDAEKWIQSLIVSSTNGLDLKLQEGKKIAFNYLLKSQKRDLQVKFYYNRTFTGGRIYEVHKGSGSYTKSFRPDYTISIWPNQMTELEAEKREAIIHIHFDAKYKVEYLDNWRELYKNVSDDVNDIVNEIVDKEILQEEKDERQGTFKNTDLYKMHAYKDAIRRTGGAYILYPGNENDIRRFNGYHEVIPGVGAFSLRPSNQLSSAENIGRFIDEIISNLEDVLSQREQYSKSKYEIFQNIPFANKKIDESLLDLSRKIGLSGNLNETYVLVGYIKSNKKHINWVRNEKYYSIRFGDNYPIDGKMAAARFLILYELNGSNLVFKNEYIFELDTTKTNVITKNQLKKLKYPTNPSKDQYILYTIKNEYELDNVQFEFDKDKFQNHNITIKKIPFAISVAELLNVRIKK